MSESEIGAGADAGGQFGQAGEAARPNADPIPPQRGHKDQVKDLLKSLREMQRSRHSLDIVRDVLADENVKLYSHMRWAESTIN